jgi:hypothetical protein
VSYDATSPTELPVAVMTDDHDVVVMLGALRCLRLTPPQARRLMLALSELVPIAPLSRERLAAAVPCLHVDRAELFTTRWCRSCGALQIGDTPWSNPGQETTR